MPTSPTTQADEYAGIIAQELRSLDTVLSGTLDDEELEVWAALELIDADPTDSWLVLDAYLNETCLEVTVLRAVSRSERTRVELLRTVGGPNCYITRDSLDGETIEVSVYWGGDSASRRLHLPTLARMLDELAGNWA